MALDAASFLVRFPEFTSAPAPLLEAVLADASARTDATVWGHLTDQGVGLLAAHLLACAPNGQFARLEKDKSQTIYGAEYERLMQAVTVGLRVV